MSENNIEEISNDYFFGCKHLRRVSIIASQIRRVPTMNDTHTVLEFLIFSDNIIPDINQLYGVPFIKLKSLDLARNKIMVVEANLMIIPAIYYVELVENRLIVIPDLTQSGWGDALPDNRTVKIRLGNGNPWHCSADMLWVVDMICTVNCASKQRHRIEISDVAKMIWHTPTNMAGRSITEVGKLILLSGFDTHPRVLHGDTHNSVN